MTLLILLLICGAFAAGVLFGWMQRGVHDEEQQRHVARQRRRWDELNRSRIGADR